MYSNSLLSYTLLIQATVRCDAAYKRARLPWQEQRQLAGVCLLRQ